MKNDETEITYKKRIDVIKFVSETRHWRFAICMLYTRITLGVH